MSSNGKTVQLKGEAIFKKDNISKMFLSTATAMIATELTGVISVLVDGIITSRFLGVEAYSGISLVRPFTSLLLVIAGFFSTGCVVPLYKHPELHPYMYAYLKGYLIGIPAMILLQILGPILVLDNEKNSLPPLRRYCAPPTSREIATA